MEKQISWEKEETHPKGNGQIPVLLRVYQSLPQCLEDRAFTQPPQTPSPEETPSLRSKPQQASAQCQCLAVPKLRVGLHKALPTPSENLCSAYPSLP